MNALSQALQEKGFTKAPIFLDNNPTHKQKLQEFFQKEGL
jgi:hypothetical protein